MTVRFWQASMASSTPSVSAGFVKILGSASANAGNAIIVNVTGTATAGNQVVVFVGGQTHTNHVTTITDSVGSIYTIRTTAHPTHLHYLAVATLPTPLTVASNVTVKFTATLSAGGGASVIVAEYKGIASFVKRTASTVTSFHRDLTITGLSPPAKGTLVIATCQDGIGTHAFVPIDPTASWTKRLQVTFTGGKATPTSAPQHISNVLADTIVKTPDTSASVSWSTPGGYLALWAFQLS